MFRSRECGGNCRRVDQDVHRDDPTVDKAPEVGFIHVRCLAIRPAEFHMDPLDHEVTFGHEGDVSDLDGTDDCDVLQKLKHAALAVIHTEPKGRSRIGGMDLPPHIGCEMPH